MKLKTALDIKEKFNHLKKKQKEFLQRAEAGENLFLTGGAGFGKSYVLNCLFQHLDERNIFFGKTASTGIAAVNIGGSTIHSWAGVGLANTDKHDILKNVLRNKKAGRRIKISKFLFIDEVSMLSADFLDKLDYVLREIRLNPAPFGGINIVLIGDPLQLPPVFSSFSNNKDFFFDAESYAKAEFKTIILDELVRQDETSEFAKLLNKIRLGESGGLELLSSRVNAIIKCDSNIKPVKIFCKNVDVDRYNNIELAKIKEEEYTFYSKDFGMPHHIEFFNRNCPAPQILKLKKGAQVMLVKNIDTENGLVNGSIGVVEAIEDNKPVVRFKSGRKEIIGEESWEIKEQTENFDGKVRYKVAATRTQIPLKICFAVTVHKCQGQTLDAAEIDMGEAFEAGMVYVALSRVRDLKSLSLQPFSPDKIKVNQKALDFWKRINQ